jgi:hypothetical protein
MARLAMWLHPQVLGNSFLNLQSLQAEHHPAVLLAQKYKYDPLGCLWSLFNTYDLKVLDVIMCCPVCMGMKIAFWLQTKESSEAQRKFANAKSISSDQYFGDQNTSGDTENTTRLQKFAVKILFQLVWSFPLFLWTYWSFYPVVSRANMVEWVVRFVLMRWLALSHFTQPRKQQELSVGTKGVNSSCNF